MDDPHGPGMKAMMILIGANSFQPQRGCQIRGSHHWDPTSGPCNQRSHFGDHPTASFSTSPSYVCASCLERGIRLPETRTKTRAIEKSILPGVEVMEASSSRLTRPVHFKTSDIYAGCGPNNVHKWDWFMLQPSVSYPPTHWQPHPSFPGTKAKAPIWRPKNRFEEDSSLNHTVLQCETSILSLLPNHKSNDKVNLWFLTWNTQPSNWPNLRIIGPSSASQIGFL